MQLDTSLEQASRESNDNVVDNHAGSNTGDRTDSGDDLPLWSPRIVYIRAAITHLDSYSIPFVVLKYDPRPGAAFERESRRLYTGQAHKAHAIREWWDAPLRALPPAQHYFLIAWSAVPGASPRVAPQAGLSFGIATPGPSNKRWITTGALGYRGELVAWCEEIDMSGAQEEIIEVEFSEERMIRLLPGHAAGQAPKVA
jgi:hypothetical protein